MSNVDAVPAVQCPNCQQQMKIQSLEQNYHGVVQVDLCFTCAGIWFDRLGSVQLAPAAVIELFKEIHSHLDDARRPLASEMGCPRCGDALALGFDLCKSGKFSYFRCPRGDGRFTPFFQFLREKQFVRSLSEAELRRLRSQVRQIRCSECGAPIDLEHSSQCQYCHAPVSFLDPEAVEKAVRMWSEAADRRHAGPTPEAAGNALLRVHTEKPVWSGASLGGHLPTGTGTGTGTGMGIGSAAGVAEALGLDLIAVGIQALGRLFERTD